MIDTRAVLAVLNYIQDRCHILTDEISRCERGEYSPLMDDARFEALAAEALEAMGSTRSALCSGLSRAHRCSQCELLVKAWLECKDKAA